MFEDFMKEFYVKMVHELSELTDHKFSLPNNTQFITNFLCSLPQRQQDCAHLLVEGINTKEIAKILQLSPRTVETHIDILKDKFKAKNKAQLIYFLNKIL